MDERKAESIEHALEILKGALDVQMEPGTINYSPYMQGMANGIIFAISVLDGEDPPFIEAPQVWLEDLDKLDEFNNSGAVIENEKNN